jgi:tRNA-specific 2-thiouridylase
MNGERMRVVVAMSGGVDSSVSAYLLKEAGHDVIGMTMKIWPGEKDTAAGQKSCCGTDAICDARRVAQLLDIPYYVIDMANDFENTVIADFVGEYMAGRTPNPCIRCNIDMKFGRLLVKAREVRADKVATGHYARLVQDPVSGRYQVFRANDLEKDQSYALWGLSQGQLSRALFPLGELEKPQVREIARKLTLPVSDKPDSQDICFVTKDYREFIAGKAPAPGPGTFVDSDGKPLGSHAGYTHFTVGQRRGLGTAFGERTYVLAIEPAANRVVLGSETQLHRQRFRLDRVNWVGTARPEGSLECLVKIRYGGPAIPAVIESDAAGDGATITAHTPLRAVAPGQSAVLYAATGSGMVLGGGLISGRGAEAVAP